MMMTRMRRANAMIVIKRPMEWITKAWSSVPVNNLSLG
jgi:hypothetical protein